MYVFNNKNQFYKIKLCILQKENAQGNIIHT